MKVFLQLLSLFILAATTCAQVPSTLEKTLFYQDTNATFRGSNQPMVDANGNVIVIATQFGFGCGFNVCGVLIYSIAPNGTLNWLKPDGGFAANTVNGVALGQDNTIYFQGFFGLGQIYAWAADGTPAPGWPVNIGFPLDTTAHTLLIDPVDGSILAKGGTNFSFGAFPGRVAAYRPDSSIKWQADFGNAANNTPGMAIGPDNNVYTTSDQGVILDRNTGQQICGFGPFAPLVGGSAGVFTHSGPGTQIIRMNADCTTAPIFTTTRTDLEVQEYDNGIIFAIDRDPLDPTRIQLLAVRADGTLLWRNSGFLLGGGVSAISAIRNGRLYVIGIDIVDQKRKLFILDENTGTIVDAFDTTGACGPCGVAVGPDSSVYLNDLQSVTIYRLSRIKPHLTLDKLSLSFSYQEGFGGQIAPQPISIESTGFPLSFRLHTITSSGGNWLSVVSDHNTTPATAFATVLSTLPAGTYMGQVEVIAPSALEPTQEVEVALVVSPKPCLISSTHIDIQASNGVIAAQFTPEETNCEGILEINNQERFWTNFRLQAVGSPTITPLGGDLNLYAKFGLLPPKGLIPIPQTSPVAFKVKFSKPGESITVFADPTIVTGSAAGLMNMIQAFLNITPGSGVAQTGIDDFIKINEAFEQMPHLKAATIALFNKPPNLKAFRKEIESINLDEAAIFVTLIRDLSGSTTRELLKLILQTPLRVVNALVNIFGELHATFTFPAGSVILTTK